MSAGLNGHCRPASDLWQGWGGSVGDGAKVGAEGLVGAGEGGLGQGWVGSVGDGAK